MCNTKPLSMERRYLQSPWKQQKKNQAGSLLNIKDAEQLNRNTNNDMRVQLKSFSDRMKEGKENGWMEYF